MRSRGGAGSLSALELASENGLDAVIGAIGAEAGFSGEDSPFLIRD